MNLRTIIEICYNFYLTITRTFLQLSLVGSGSSGSGFAPTNFQSLISSPRAQSSSSQVHRNKILQCFFLMTMSKCRLLSFFSSARGTLAPIPWRPSPAPSPPPPLTRARLAPPSPPAPSAPDPAATLEATPAASAAPPVASAAPLASAAPQPARHCHPLAVAAGPLAAAAADPLAEDGPPPEDPAARASRASLVVWTSRRR